MGEGLVTDYKRTLAFFLGILFGGVFVHLGNPLLSIVCFAVVFVIGFCTVRYPDSAFAIQEDARSRQRRWLEGLLADCLAYEGLETSCYESSLVCYELEPAIRFQYESNAYGTSEGRIAAVCESALPLFAAVRFTVERTLSSDGGRNRYLIGFHRTSETEALEGMKVAYSDIEGEQPTYGRIPVGRYEDGGIAYMSFDNRNALIGGLPRSGKSVLLSVVVIGLCRCDNERVLVLSPKILDFQAFAERVELYQEPEEMLKSLTQINDEVESRKRYCERERKKKVETFTGERPHITIVIDEYAVIKGFQTLEEGKSKPRKIGEEIERELLKIVSQAAFAGVQVAITSQRLSSNVVSTDLRDICAGNLISFSNGSATSDKMVFGEYHEQAPASLIPIKAKGVGYIFSEGDMEKPRLFKCALTSVEDEYRIAGETAYMKPRRGNEREEYERLPL